MQGEIAVSSQRLIYSAVPGNHRFGFIGIFRLFRGYRLAMDRSAPTTRLYSEVVKKDTDLETSPTWLRNYQRDDEEEATKRALNESVKVTISVEE